MTLVSLPIPMPFPGIMTTPYGSPTAATVATVDATGEYVAYVFSAREDMVISHIGFRVGAVTNSPTMEVRVETLDATSFPSGTLWATNTNGTTGVVGSSTWVLQALTASATITKGQIFCIKLLWGGVATSTVIIQQISNLSAPAGSVFPYQVVNTGTPTKSSIGNLPQLAIGSSSTTFYNVTGVMGASSFSTGTFNNTSSAKRGLRFVPPMNCRAVGIRWHNSTAIGDYNIVLTNDAGTELSSSLTAIDGDATVATNSGSTAYFDNSVLLTAGTAYRVAIEPTSATNCNVSTLTLPSSDYFSSTPASAPTVAQYAALVSGTWTDSTTQIPLMDVLLDQIDNGSGSGGGGIVGVIGG